MTEPCDLPAVTARALIGERKLSPVELMDSCIRRIEEIDPAVNAVIARSFDIARATAQESEAAVMRGDSLGPLHGLPLGVKDLIDAKGLPTSFGSMLFADNIAAEDEAVVAMLKRRRRHRRRQDQRPRMGRGRQHSQRAPRRHWQPVRS
jgi:amidase